MPKQNSHPATALKPLLLAGFTVTFVTGLFGADPQAALFVAIGTFLPACGLGGTWWGWSILSLSAWAAGSGVVILLSMVSPSSFPDAARELHVILTIFAAFGSGLAGTSLNWAASRITQQR